MTKPISAAAFRKLDIFCVSLPARNPIKFKIATTISTETLKNILGGLGGHLENLSNETDMIAGALDEGSGAISRLDTHVTSLEDEASRALTLPARRQHRAVNGG